MKKSSGISDWAHGEFRAHGRKIFCLTFNCDGTRLATGSQDRTVKIWKSEDISSVKQESELRGHTEAVMYVRWHPTHPDKLASIATSETPPTVRFWDQRTGKSTATLTTPGHNLYLAWTRDGNYIAVGSKEDVVSIVDVRKMKIAHKYPYRYQVNEFAFTADDSTFLQSTGNSEVEIYKYPEMQRTGALKGHTSSVLSLAVDPQQKYIATGGADALACLWDARDYICLQTYYHIDNPVRSLAFSHDSKYLAMTGEDPAVFVEDVENRTTFGSIKLAKGPDDVAWHPKQHILVYPVDVDQDKSFVQWKRGPTI